MVDQPMGKGVGPTRFQENMETAETQAKFIEEQAVHRAAEYEDFLRTNPFLQDFARDMEEVMLRVYQDSPDGQAQLRMIKKMQIGIDPTWVIKNLRRKLMGASLSALAETPAAP